MEFSKQIVAFCHFKGGVGNSFLASNVALELAKHNFLTCVIDFDTKLPNCANILGLEVKKQNSLSRYFANKNPDKKGDFFAYDKKISPYLYIISSSSEEEVEILEDINESGDEIGELLNTVKKIFDIVIVDLPTDYQNPQVLGTLEKADKVFTVGDMDINTIENSFRSLQMYKSIDISLTKFVYIINRYFENDDITPATVHDTLGIRVGSTVPLDYNAAYESIMTSNPIVNSEHKITDSIRDICLQITGHIGFEEGEEEEQEDTESLVDETEEEVAPAKFNLIDDEESEEQEDTESLVDETEEEIESSKFNLIDDGEGEETNGDS